MASDLDLGECKDWRLFYRDRAQRRRFAWEVLVAIAFGVALACLTYAASAEGAPLFKGVGSNGEPMSLRLLDEPCSDEKVLVHLVRGVKPEYLGEFKAALLVWGGRTWASCWIEIEGRVLSIDEEGAPLNPPNGVPRAAFRDDSV